MEIINRRQRISALARKLHRENKTIGLVPTMGALHDGHLALVQEARQKADIVIVSIFVNPVQFNEKEDFERYPRDLTADAALLAGYQVDYVFAPDADEIYPPGFATYVFVEDLTDPLEGAARPGHFRGVATVVSILFNLIRPDTAYFGQKDAQQVSVIERLTKDLAFGTEIVTVPTVRDETGLALSSRNSLLSSDEKAAATVINQALSQARSAFADGERNASRLTEIVCEMLKSEPLALVDYVAAVDRMTLEPVDKIGENPVLIAVAVRFGKTRLIDNVILDARQ
jgi:pantoate--beta-alanine ligase